MESSVEENEAQKSFRSPPRRRRSTFFEKRDSIVLQPMTENIKPSVTDKLNDVDNKHNENLKRYHDVLLAEKNDWKAEVKSRRSKYHDLKQQYQVAVNAPSKSKISYSSLSSEDIDFLKKKVNISQLVESQSKLHESVKQTQTLYRRLIELDNAVLTHCDKKLKEVTDYILEHSTVE